MPGSVFNEDLPSHPILVGGTFTPRVYSRGTVPLTSQPATPPQPPALPPLAPGAMMRASCLHPRTPHWCSATVGASQVSGRQSGRPSSPPSRRDWCQGCALPGRLPSSPARHPVEPVLGVRGQDFWGESVCPVLPWRQLFPRPTVELPEGGSWARAGDWGVGRDATTFLPPPYPTGDSRGALG